MLGSAQAHFRSNGLSATGARQLLEALPAEATVEGMEGSTHKTWENHWKMSAKIEFRATKPSEQHGKMKNVGFTSKNEFFFT
jgi:hypothetical protein